MSLSSSGKESGAFRSEPARNFVAGISRVDTTLHNAAGNEIGIRRRYVVSKRPDGKTPKVSFIEARVRRTLEAEAAYLSVYPTHGMQENVAQAIFDHARGLRGRSAVQDARIGEIYLGETPYAYQYVLDISHRDLFTVDGLFHEATMLGSADQYVPAVPRRRTPAEFAMRNLNPFTVGLPDGAQINGVLLGRMHYEDVGSPLPQVVFFTQLLAMDGLLPLSSVGRPYLPFLGRPEEADHDN